jgi:hypothetical protein
MFINPLPITNNINSKQNITRYAFVKTLLSRINLEKEIVFPFFNTLFLGSRKINVAS